MMGFSNQRCFEFQKTGRAGFGKTVLSSFFKKLCPKVQEMGSKPEQWTQCFSAPVKTVCQEHGV